VLAGKRGQLQGGGNVTFGRIADDFIEMREAGWLGHAPGTMAAARLKSTTPRSATHPSRRSTPSWCSDLDPMPLVPPMVKN